MHNLRISTLFLALLMSTVAVAQPRSISKIVDKSSISQEGEEKIKKYAVGWAEQLQTTDAELLEQAHSKLVDPFEPSARITPYARSLYGKYLEEGFGPLLNQDSTSEMAAVNALQILSLLGTDQACGVLLKHADASNEGRAALRLWASTGLGTSFLTGELPLKRIVKYATLLAGPVYIGKEQEWFVLARQFDSLAALQSIPNIDNRQRDALASLSFELQTKALVNLLDSINAGEGTDERVRSLPLILPSLLLQIIEPSVEEEIKSKTLDAIVPSLIAFVEYAAKQYSGDENEFLRNSYGGAAHSASLLIVRAVGSDGDIRVIDLWNNDDYPEILELVETWKAKQ